MFYLSLPPLLPLPADHDRLNDDARLAARAQELHELHALDMLSELMPLGCDLLRNYQELLQPSLLLISMVCTHIYV